MNQQLTQVYGYLHGMWRYRWSALVIAWIVALLGWPIVLSLPDQFTARTVVYVDTSSVLKPLLKGLTPETDSQDELQIMTRMLLSRENLMSIARETDMDLKVNSIAESEALVEHLAATIKIKNGGGRSRGGAKNKVYVISFKSSSADQSYQVVSNLLNTMIEDTLNSTRIDTVSAQKFLSQQIDQYEEELSLAEQNLVNFKKENVGYMPDERGGYYLRLQRAQGAVGQTVSSLRIAERSYSELTRQLNGESPILNFSSGLTVNARKIQKYKAQLEVLLNKYTEQHPDVMALESIINDLTTISADVESSEVMVSEVTGDEVSNPVYQAIKVEQGKARVEIEKLKSKLNERQNQVIKLQDHMDIIPEVEAKLVKLNRGYEVTHKRYLKLVERKESAKLAQSVGQSSSEITFRVIEPPMVPYKPSGPNRALFLSGVLLAALGAGLVWSFLRYMLQPTFIDLTQLGTVTGLPVLGIVSLYLSPKHRNRRRWQLSSFVLATSFLVVVFGAVFLLRDTGAAFFASVIMGV